MAAVALHGRTAAQRYSGHGRLGRDRRRSRRRSTSRCSATATSGRPTTRCGWSRETGCDGVVVGRGCLGRPWLFADLAAAFAGRPERAAARRSARSPRRCAGTPSCWSSWLRRRRARTAAATSASTSPGTSRASRSAASCAARWRMVDSLAELDDLLGKLDPAEPFPVDDPRPAARPDQLARQGRPAGRLAGQPRRRHRARAAPSWTTPAAEPPAFGWRRLAIDSPSEPSGAEAGR